MPGKNHQGFRFSGLTEITPENVKQLKVAWTFSLGVEKGQEAAPIVAGNTMFVVTPYPNIVYALDLTKPGAPSSGSSSRSRPRRRRASPAATWSIAAPPMPTARSSSTRSTTRPIALDAETGKELWRTKLGDINARRDDDDGAAGRQGQGAGRQQRRRVRRAGLADRARREHRQDRLARLQHRPRQGRADRRRLQAVLRRRTRARTSASRPGRPRPGRSAAAPCGAGSPTTRSST